MPAIQLARLRIEVAELAEHFQNPEHFANHLNHLMEFYANRTKRPKLKGAPPPTLKTFNIPQPVFRQLIVELSPLAMTEFEATLDIIDRCWAEPVYEFRLLAIHLIGLISPQYPEKILDRVHIWLKDSIEDSIIQLIFEVGLARLREETIMIYVGLIENLLFSNEKNQMVFGLVGLHSLTETESFNNLPLVFRLFQSSIEHENKYFRPYLLKIIKQLVKISPQETAYIFKNLLKNTATKEVLWLTRQSIEFFPIDLKAEIKKILRKLR